ncbi:MAG: phosphodiesterase [Pseudomonadales bacterium]
MSTISTHFKPAVISLLIGLQASVCAADLIKIPIGQQDKELQHLSKPTRGQSKAQVELQFGVPVQRYNARGEPPISRWEYAGFMVFFEYEHVIHSVVKHRPNEDAELSREVEIEALN